MVKVKVAAIIIVITILSSGVIMQTFKKYIPNIMLKYETGENSLNGLSITKGTSYRHEKEHWYESNNEDYFVNSARVSINNKPVTGWIANIKHLILRNESSSCNNNL